MRPFLWVLPFLSIPCRAFHASNRPHALGAKLRSSAANAPPRSTALGAGAGADDDERLKAIKRDIKSVQKDGLWTLRNDFSQFLNQAAIQQLIFLTNSLRDRQTALWIEEFTEPVLEKRTMSQAADYVYSDIVKAAKTSSSPSADKNIEIKLLTYHGLSIINTTKFPTWESYFDRLLEQPKEGYIIRSENKYVPDYEWEVSPPSICTRLLSVREQIAREFVRDLGVIGQSGKEMLNSYWKRLEDRNSFSDEEVSLDRTNLLFLDLNVNNENLDHKPSPLRKNNFDLLTTLATQESIHRLLNDAADRDTVHFLSNFYANRIGTHFRGSQFYGRADDFLQQLLEAPPSIAKDGDDSSMLFDPVGLIGRILEMRETVATEWKTLAMEVPDSHFNIKRKGLDLMMMGAGTSDEGAFE